uniref:Uncharacterized protein n=1 Tax=Klebsiella pneumoniae TaxID=573 RepID=A0A8B0SVZ4_KLEPN|nr:hypothetical protein [Klebsiella pneumoniae]
MYDPTAETSVIPGFSKGYVEYKSGMTVNLNPITFCLPCPFYEPQGVQKKVGWPSGT